ncbi:MAG TPA: 2-C-methyl-D-erythritol 4-phosphate cytidylyltransferase [Verrucomicrobiae bacterium]|nr:2-C-methyl-D-erythritol 4-phosphate cytidylyltransferase [Verrucomicrobiae bacterium]
MNVAILVAAGRGARMGADKLFLEVAGRPVVAHTWKRFDDAKSIDEIIVVVRAGMEKKFAALARKYKFRKKFQIVTGGAERQDSVWAGLEAAPPKAEIVAIHDAARPCVNNDLIAATVKYAEETGAAVAAHPVTDTIKESADGRLVQRTLDRSQLWAMETPQTFRSDVIRRAISAARAKKMIFTDDTASCELIGQPVRLVSSIAPNPKVTVPGDLAIIEALLRKRNGH